MSSTKYTIFFVFCSLIFSSSLLAQRDRKADEAGGWQRSAKVITANRYIVVAVAPDGRFTEGTTDRRRLLYGFPAEGGPSATSHTVFNINGNFYSNAEWLGTRTPALVLASTIIDSSVYTVWEIDSVRVSQILTPVFVSAPTGETGTLLIKYRFENFSSRAQSCGVLLLLDTMINTNDAAPIASSFGYSGVEQDFRLTHAMPDYWRAYEFSPDQPPGYLVGEGTLNGGEAIPPDRFCLGPYPRYSRVIWEYTSTGGRYGDSAVLLWWYPKTVLPGERFEVATYYGLGLYTIHHGALNLNLMVPTITARGCLFNPNPIEINLLVTNPRLSVAESVSATIFLQAGLTLDPSQTQTHLLNPPTIPRYGTSFTTWHPYITGESTGDTVNLQVVVQSPSISAPETVQTRIYIPPLEGYIDAFITSPQELAISSCPEQEVVFHFELEGRRIFPREFLLLINGDTLNQFNPYLATDTDTNYIYTPPSPYASGDTINFAIISATDSLGCEIREPVIRRFIVDTEGPIASDPNPAPNSVIYNFEPLITLSLFDEITPVEPSSITLTVNGEEFNISNGLIYSDGRLRLTSERFRFGDGQSVRVCLTRAHDSPTLCEPNQLQHSPFCWTFRIEIVNLAIPDTAAFPAETLLIPVYIQDISGLGITSFNLAFGFDERVLIPVEASFPLASGWRNLDFTVAGGQIRVTGNGLIPLEGEGIFAVLKFIVNPDALLGEFTPVYLVDGDFNEGEIKTICEAGSVLIMGSPGQWMVDLTITGSASCRLANVLTFGAKSGSSDGFEPGIDIVAIPPVPECVYAYFPIEDPSYPHISALQRDIRGLSRSIVWRIVTRDEPSGTIHWNPASLPEGRFLLNRSIDMRTDSVYHFGTNEELAIVYSVEPPQRSEIRLYRGWNLISFEVLPPVRDRITNIIPVISAFGYSSERGYFVPESPGPGCGYWVFSSADTTVTIGGLPVNRAQVPLAYGWNLIGGVYGVNIPFESIRTEPPGLIVRGSLFQYEPGSASYSPSDTIGPGKGYWIFSGGIGELLLEPGFKMLGKFVFSQSVLIPPAPPEIANYKNMAHSGLVVFPNPFNSFITIVPPTGTKRLFVKDLLGRNVATIDCQNGNKTDWNAKDLPSGLYFITTESAGEIKKVILLR